MEKHMKLEDLFEADVVDFDQFRKRKMGADVEAEPDYSDARFDPDVAADIMKSMERGEHQKSSPEAIDDEMEKRRFMKILNNTNGRHIEAVDLVPFLRDHITDRKEFKTFANRLLTGNEHLYILVKYINDLLSKSNAPERVVGVSQDGEDWYFSK